MTNRDARSFIISRPFPEAFAGHLREAVEALGYYDLSALDQLVAMYRDRWEGGISASMFRRDEVAPLLSEKGHADIDHAQRATFLRAHFNLRREESDATESSWSTFCSQVEFVARAQWLCDEARSLNGTIVSRQERWSIPLSGCRQEWCPCRWDMVPDRL